MTRSRATLALYAAFGCLGYMLVGLGAVLPELRLELDLSRAEVALYPQGFALGLLLVGAGGDRLAQALGEHAVPVALVTMGAGAVVLAAGSSRMASAAGALLVGLGGAWVVQLVPARLRAEHDDRAAVAIGEANALGSAAGVLAPLLVGAALAAGLGWRAGYLALPLAVIAAVLLALLSLNARAGHRQGGQVDVAGPVEGDGPTGASRHGEDGGLREDGRRVESDADVEGGRPPLRVAEGGAGLAGRAPRPFVKRWVDLVLVITAEFCLVFWAADFLGTERGLTADTAAIVAGLFVFGMAAGRAASGAVTRLVPDASRLLIGSAALATAGFALLWLVDQPFAAAAGLLLNGIGMALLYPVMLAEALAVWPGQPHRAAARCALASAVGVGGAPLVLGALADTLGLRLAMLLAPLLLVTFVVRRARSLPTAVAG